MPHKQGISSVLPCCPSLVQVDVPAVGQRRSDSSTLVDSKGENGHSLGAIFHQPGRERRTPSDGVPKHQGSFV